MIVSGMMFCEALENFPGKIQAGETGIFFLQLFHDPQAVRIVFKTAVAFHQAGEHRFRFMPKGRVAEIVRERDGLGEVGVQAERAGNVARDGGDFNSMRQPCTQMIPGAVEKHLGLVFETAESARMDDPVAVPLVLCAPERGCLGKFASACIATELGQVSQGLAFQLFEFQSIARHGSNSSINSSIIPAPKCRAVQTGGGWCLQSNCWGSWRRR